MDNRQLQEIIESLDKEWEIPDDHIYNDQSGGFFYKARRGIMDEHGYLRVKSLLERAKEIVFTCPDEEFINRDFVRAIWFLPLFLTWQERFIKQNGFPVDIYMGQWVARIEQLVEDILGSP
jgi:hypothetical protein